MARKQSDYLAGLLAEETSAASEEPPVAAPLSERTRGLTLLARETALARVASGEIRQVTQLALDPRKVRVWAGNARAYSRLSETNTRDLIDSMIAEGGQKVPAVVRRIEGDPEHDYEVVAGTRRHFAISWLRANSYPDMLFIAQVHTLDDEAAFRIADIENRARRDVSDIERARNYAAALKGFYGGHLTRMAERLNISKGWLSKMVRVASIPDGVVAAFASPDELQLKPAYSLAQALDDKAAAKAIAAKARLLAAEQEALRRDGRPPLPSSDVLRALLAAPTAAAEKAEPYAEHSRYGRPILTVPTANRHGLTLKIHAGSGADVDELIDAVRRTIEHFESTGKVALR